LRPTDKRDGTLKETLSVVIQFEKNIPKSVQIGYMKYSVREFIPKPLRCYACQRMGHTARCGGSMRMGNVRKRQR